MLEKEERAALRKLEHLIKLNSLVYLIPQKKKHIYIYIYIFVYDGNSFSFMLILLKTWEYLLLIIFLYNLSNCRVKFLM